MARSEDFSSGESEIPEDLKKKSGMDSNLQLVSSVASNLQGLASWNAIYRQSIMNVANTLNKSLLSIDFLKQSNNEFFRRIAVPNYDFLKPFAQIIESQQKIMENFAKGSSFLNSLHLSSSHLQNVAGNAARMFSAINFPLSSWLPADTAISGYFEHVGGPDYPINMKEALGSAYDREWLTTVLYDEGIPLYVVPNPRIITRLRNSKGEPTHRSILGRELSNIADDCRPVIKPRSTNTKEREISQLIEESIEVISEGHLAAGNALLTSVLDLMIQRRLPNYETARVSPNSKNIVNLSDVPKGKGFKVRINGKPAISFVEEYAELPNRIALLPMLSAYRTMYEKARGPYIETGYSRHAIAHRPQKKLFTKANTAQALLCATSLAAYVYKW